MVTATVATATREALTERVGPALETLEKNARQLRRAVIRGRHTAEDVAAEAALKIRRHPLAAVSTAMCTGLTVGTVIGFFLGRNGCARA